MTRLRSTDVDVAAAWNTAVNDLGALALGEPSGPTVPMAGLPIYQQVFGRDGLTVSWQALLAGSVWPVESGTTALGLARFGCWTQLHTLAKATFAAAALFEGHRLPEAISGLPRDAAHPHQASIPRPAPRRSGQPAQSSLSWRHSSRSGRQHRSAPCDRPASA